MNLEQYTAAKKLFETFDARAVDNDLTIEQAWSNNIADQAVAQRQELLVASDWTQLPDSPLSDSVKAAWATYRQSLRDLPTASGFPHTMTWPIKPS
jgi:hypothetical protein